MNVPLYALRRYQRKDMEKKNEEPRNVLKMQLKQTIK